LGTAVLRIFDPTALLGAGLGLVAAIAVLAGITW